MSSILVDLHYLPTIQYFCLLKESHSITFEAHENYVKQSYRNRTSILGANGPTTLSIPIKDGNKKISIQHIEIAYDQNWTNNHWRAIQSAYGKAPFFEYYADFFHQIYKSKPSSLFQLNTDLLTLCLKLLQFEIPVKFSDEYVKLPENGVIDMRSSLHPKKESKKTFIFNPQPYLQLFGNEFVPNMSIIDLLFCEGTNASNIITQSVTNS